jgi:membrane protease YdiL (CAAX protease family)
MGIFLFLAVAIPYYISNYVYKNGLIHYRFHHGRNWYKTEILYIGALVVVTYFLFPFMLKNTSSYLNWTVKPTADYLIPFFIGLNLIGAWDEFFFMSTVFTTLQKHMRFIPANITQCVIFTSFLYEL